MNKSDVPQLLVEEGQQESEMGDFSLSYQLHELRESRNVILERIVGKLVRRSSAELPTGDLELELMHLKDYAMRLVSR